jgi:sec-independent protein translocase protein TatB
MLNFSPEKLFLVGIIALVVLGPHRLPQAARSFGRFMAQMRHMSSNFQEEVRGALHDPLDAVNSVIGDFRPPDVRRSVRDVITTTLTPPSSSPQASPESSPPSSNGTLHSNGPVNSSGTGHSNGPGPSNGQDAPSLPVAPDDPSLN